MFGRCGRPLYLKLASEEARGWASYLPAEECLLGEGVEGVIDTLLNRLSLEVNHGPLLVARGLGYLAAARYGLTEDEMLDVLSADEDVWQDFERRAHHTPPERRLPVIVWSRFFLDLGRRFFHKYFGGERGGLKANAPASRAEWLSLSALVFFARGGNARRKGVLP